MISSDGGVVEAGADVFYKIIDAEKFVLSLQELDSPLRTLVMASLKNNFVRRDVEDMQTNKLIIAAEIKVRGFVYLLRLHLVLTKINQ